MFEDATLNAVRDALYHSLPSLVFLVNALLGFTFFSAILANTAATPDFLSGMRRFTGALLPWAIGFFLVATGTLSVSFALAILLLPAPLLSLLGLILGVTLVELWHHLGTTNDDVVYALTNAVLSTLLLGVLSFLLFPTHRITAWLIVPIYVGMLLSILFRGWPPIHD